MAVLSMSGYCWVLLLVFGNYIQLGSGLCSLCFEYDEPTNKPNGVIKEGQTSIPCSLAESMMQALPEGTADCAQWQLQAYFGCGCPRIPQDRFCAMCADNLNSTNNVLPSERRFQTILLDTIPAGTICDDARFIQTSDPAVCLEYKRAASFCGCPGAPAPTCSAVCQPPSTNAADRLLPPLFTRNCQDMYVQSPYYLTEQDCDSFQTPSYEWIDESTYCCANDVPEQPAAMCELCVDSGSLTNPTRLVTVNERNNIQMTCKDLQTLSFVVTDATYCQDFIHQAALVEACCLGFTDSPTAEPSLAPSDSPTETPSLSPTRSLVVAGVMTGETSHAVSVSPHSNLFYCLYAILTSLVVAIFV